MDFIWSLSGVTACQKSHNFLESTWSQCGICGVHFEDHVELQMHLCGLHLESKVVYSPYWFHVESMWSPSETFGVHQKHLESHVESTRNIWESIWSPTRNIWSSSESHLESTRNIWSPCGSTWNIWRVRLESIWSHQKYLESIWSPLETSGVHLQLNKIRKKKVTSEVRTLVVNANWTSETQLPLHHWGICSPTHLDYERHGWSAEAHTMWLSSLTSPQPSSHAYHHHRHYLSCTPSLPAPSRRLRPPHQHQHQHHQQQYRGPQYEVADQQDPQRRHACHVIDDSAAKKRPRRPLSQRTTDDDGGTGESREAREAGRPGRGGAGKKEKREARRPSRSPFRPSLSCFPVPPSCFRPPPFVFVPPPPLCFRPPPLLFSALSSPSPILF